MLSPVNLEAIHYDRSIYEGNGCHGRCERPEGFDGTDLQVLCSSTVVERGISFSGPYTQSLSQKEKCCLYVFVAYRC